MPDWNRVRYEMLDTPGLLRHRVVSEHFSEYVPWFIKRDRPDLIEQFNIPLDEYIRRCEVQIAGWEFVQYKIDHPEASSMTCGNDAGEVRQQPLPDATLHRAGAARNCRVGRGKVHRSHEYGSGIIHSIETGIAARRLRQCAQHGLIDNLPQGCCVEVPCLVDKNGVQPIHIGALPPHLAALMQTNINVQALTVEAALTGKREHIYHAAMLDPHTAAELDLDQIWHLVDDLIEAHGDWLPMYH